ncbi:hypothetical protein [Gimesia sp.]|uniref:hypothetical protein n=1 Tax=Gimesia sp. TaxID=2024833 RepID=UPI003A93EDA7
MQKQIFRNILIYLGGGLVCVGLLFWFLESFNRSQGHWEAEIGQAESQLALTLRLAGREDRPFNRQIVMADREAGTYPSGTFTLPDQSTQMPGNRQTFQDTTIRPGRVTFQWEGHEFDLMLNGLWVDGKQYDWNDQTPIVLGG